MTEAKWEPEPTHHCEQWVAKLEPDAERVPRGHRERGDGEGRARSHQLQRWDQGMSTWKWKPDLPPLCEKEAKLEPESGSAPRGQRARGDGAGRVRGHQLQRWDQGMSKVKLEPVLPPRCEKANAKMEPDSGKAHRRQRVRGDGEGLARRHHLMRRGQGKRKAKYTKQQPKLVRNVQ